MQQIHKTFVLPEGGMTPASLPGALSLAIDVVENEREMGMAFDHIFLDAGTGFTACALLLGLGYLKSKSCVHILLLAEGEASFHQRLEQCHHWFSQMQPLSPAPQPFVLYRPEAARDLVKHPLPFSNSSGKSPVKKDF